MHLLLEVFQIVSLGFSNMEWVQFRISRIAWQWLEDAYVNVLLTSYMYLQVYHNSFVLNITALYITRATNSWLRHTYYNSNQKLSKYGCYGEPRTDL